MLFTAPTVRLWAFGLSVLLLISCQNADKTEAETDRVPSAVSYIEALEADFARLIDDHPDHPEYRPKARYLTEEYRRFASRFSEHEEAPEMLFRAANLEADALDRPGVAVGLFRKLTDGWPEAEQAPRAQFLIGYTLHHQMEQKERAAEAYEAFLERYPDHELRAAVEDELMVIESGFDIDEFIRNL